MHPVGTHPLGAGSTEGVGSVSEDRPWTQKERELIEMLTDALKRAAARWTPPRVKVDDDAE